MSYNRYCLNCVFLRHYNVEDFEVPKWARDAIIENKKVGEAEAILGCYRNIWKKSTVSIIKEQPDESGSWNKEMIIDVAIIEEEIFKPREDSCFFYPYQEGLLMEGAIDLQRRDMENEQFKNELSKTRVGLWIAAAGLAIGAFFEFLNYFFPPGGSPPLTQ